MVRTAQKASRWFSPITLVLAGLSFMLPFATVSCDVPGGFGRAAPGGTTQYTGAQLVLGSAPSVTPPDKVRPGAQDASLHPQPAVAVVLLLIVAGIGFGLATPEKRLRRAGLAALTGAAATALLVNQALVESDLAVRIGDQLTEPLPAGKVLRDYVHTGQGFGICLLLLLAILVSNVVGWLRARPRAALVAPGSAPPPVPST